MQQLVNPQSAENKALLKASYRITNTLLKAQQPYSEGEYDFVRHL
jgi:hypothetical protein